MGIQSFIVDRLKDKTIKGLEWKLLINNILFLILIIFMFRGLYQTANIINYEIQFQNYLDNLNNPAYYSVTSYQNELGLYDLTRNDSQILNSTLAEDPDKLEFPRSFKYLIGVTFFLLLNSVYYVAYLHTKVKRLEKEEKEESLFSLSSFIDDLE